MSEAWVRAVKVGVLCLVVGLASLALTWQTPGQQVLLRVHHYGMAEWLRGTGAPPSLTYPLWGYGFLLAWLPLALVRVGSVAVGAVASTLLYSELRHLEVLHEPTLRWGLIGAVPWYIYCGVAWPDGLSFSLLTLAGVGLMAAQRLRRTWPLLAAALCVGAGAQFRSEVLVFGLGLVAVAVLVGWWLGRATVRPLVIVPLVALLMTPWMLHYHRATGHVSALSSNGGGVAWITLGELPDNPWGVVAVDEQAADTLTELGSDAAPFSHEGGRLLRRQWVRAVSEHPGAFAHKALRNGVLVGLGGVFLGEPAGLDPTVSDQLRERLKHLAGRGQTSPSEASVGTLALVGAGLWLVLGLAWGDLMVVCIAAGAVRVIWRHREPALFMLLALIAAQWLLIAVFQYHPRHVTPFALWGVPLVALLVGSWHEVRRD